MSNPLENASVATPDNEETAQAPETSPSAATDAAEDNVENAEEAATSTPEPENATEAEGSSTPEATEPEAAASDEASDESAPEDSEGEGSEPKYVEREALVAPDLSDLPDDIGDDFEKAIEATVLEFREGDIVEGTIVNVDSEGALVDIGYKSEGFIPTRELSIRNNIDPETTVEVGDRVESVVLDKEDDEGRLILSKKRAMYERAWGQIQ